MAIKKSELYSSLWQSCDELRGGMDASQYKDYVLVMLFIKYVSDKYAGVPFAPITIPAGSSFKDMVALKGSTNIGDDINKKIIAPLADANKLSDLPDFNDATKLGDGKEKVERLTNLISIFENKALDFSNNRAEGDDIRPDASLDARAAAISEWYRQQLKNSVPALIAKYERKMKVNVAEFGIKKMKTKWGTCIPNAGRIWLNLELAKKPPECLEYIVVHEMTHLLEPSHNERFVALMDKFMPKWRFYKDELNRLPVRHESWVY